MSGERWRPVAVCWDPEEGVFPAATRVGEPWPEHAVAYRDEEFETEQEAQLRAWEVDYEDGPEGWIEIED